MEHPMLADGLTTLRSSYGPKDTMDRLEAEVKARGMTAFARIDHAAGAAAAGLALRPTEVLIFGNARAGTPLMQAVQTVGLDLPLRALVWQDASGDTWLSYNDPAWLSQRHGISGETDKAVGMMTAALDAVAKAATASGQRAG
jgi:uncharacterized protein (DUF302 family)